MEVGLPTLFRDKSDKRHYTSIFLFSYQQRSSCHLLWLFQSHQFDESRCDVSQASTLAQGIRRIRIYQNKRHWIRRMSSKRLSCLIINQLFCISMVCTDEHLSIHFLDRLYCSADAFIDSYNCFDRRCLHSSVSHHVWVCKVDNNHIIFLRANCLH